MTRTQVHPTVERGVAVHLEGVLFLYRQDDTEVVALRGVDLDVAAGEMVALVGPSGMGKTTVLRLMAGLLQATAGLVRVGDWDLGRMSATQRRALLAGEIGYIAQGTGANILPFATVLENLWFAQHGARARGRTPPLQADELLEALGLEGVARRRVNELPRGVRQQVAVIAGVAAGARVVLADEPTAQLTKEAGAEVVGLFRRINERFGTTVVIVTHDPGIAAELPRTLTIRDGRVGSIAQRGEEFAVVDRTGSIQLPPDLLELMPPNSRVRIVRYEDRIELRGVEDEP